MSEASLVRGASIYPPQVLYTTSTPEARVVVSRHEWSLAQGIIVLEPTKDWRERTSTKEGNVFFQLKQIIPGWRPHTDEDRALTLQLFALLARHHLLSHPDFLLAEAPPALTGANAALDVLRAQVQKILEEKNVQGLYCSQCEKDKWGTLSSQDRLRMYWKNRVVAEVCPHAKLLPAALRQVFTQFPELLFEVLGLLAPEAAPKSKEKPLRYTLTPYAFLASLGQKLLGTSEHLEEATLSKPRLSTKKIDKESRENKERVYFSAAAWGYTGRAESFEGHEASDVYPMLGGEALPPRVLEEPIAPQAAKPANRKKIIIEPSTQPAEEPEVEPTGISMDVKIFLQEVGEADETLEEMLRQMKRLAPSIQKTIQSLPMKKVIELLYDLDE